MTTHRHSEGDIPEITFPKSRWRRLLWRVGASLFAALLLLLILWNVFFHYVPPGQMLVIVSKNGTELTGGRVLAREGEKGIQEKVLGEGWHYVTPIIYTTERKPNVVI